MAPLTGKVVVITGSTRGFGRVLAEQVADRGARVVVSGPWPEEAEKQAAALRERGIEALAAPGDVTDQAQVEALADAAVAAYGRIDIWVNNAAAATPVGRAFDIDPAEFRRAVSVNVLGTYYGARAAGIRMLAGSGGVIVNMLGRGDNTGPTPYTSPYGATKAWVRGFTRTLQKEYEKTSVRVVGFNPGMMLTDMLLNPHVVGDEGERAMKPFAVVTRIFADPPEVAAAELVAVLERDRPPRAVNRLGPAGATRHLARTAVRAITRRGAAIPALKVERLAVHGTTGAGSSILGDKGVDPAITGEPPEEQPALPAQ
ncbi:SDR family NAD(P)-dependent oxidoreductase [Melissospora conviva]|uniref:SDR family NAD(P)-dependent oxidoreductase n=1 Tax=Melissospora conviva TaxID=3388432 RepID=UPI003C16A104